MHLYDHKVELELVRLLNQTEGGKRYPVEVGNDVCKLTEHMSLTALANTSMVFKVGRM